MKILITENRMINLYQSLINRCIDELISMGNGEIPEENWVDPYVFAEAEAIDSITVNDVEVMDENYPSFSIMVVEIHADVILDSLKFYDLENLNYHIEYFIKANTFGKSDRGVKIDLSFDSVELKNKNPQW
jgi:hypothetical protein